MPDVAGTTRAQTIFLRAFHKHPAGPPASEWPSPAILRRWLRRPAFEAAMSTLQNVLQYQANFHLATAATQAAQRLTVADADGTPLSALELRRLAELLRLAHLRQRFPADTPVSSPATFEFRDKVEYLQNEIDDQDPDHPTDPAEIQDVRDELDDLRANFQPTRRKT